MTGLDPQARELVIRTVLGEAANEPDDGMAAVAAVIRNRAASGRFGGTVPEVVLARHQFEPWSTPAGRSRMMSYAPDSEAYRRASAAVDRVFGEGIDPTSGATHFFSPSAQSALGRTAPTWARGDGQAIGRHTFFAPEGRVTMAAQEVTDADVLARFNQARGAEVTDPEVLSRFKGSISVKPTGSVIDRALEPITSYPETYREMRQESQAQMERGADQFSSAISGDGDFPDRAWEAAKGAGNVAMGGLGYVASPVNAALRTVVGKPVEEATGAPKELTEFATSLAIPGLGFTRAGALRPVMAPPRAVTAGDEVIESARNVSDVSGVTVQLPRSVTSDSIVANQAGRTVANIPLAGAPLRKAAEQGLESVDQAATAIRGGYGSGEMASAGAAAREGLETALKSGPFKKKVSALYKAVDQYVNPVITAPLANTRLVRDAISARRINAALPQSRNVDELQAALKRPGLNYEGVKDLRTFFGEMKDGNIPIPQGMTAVEVDRIYGALSKDLRLIVAKAGGSEGLKAFEKANREAARWAKVRETLMPLLRVKNDEGIVSRILAAASSSSRADEKLLARVRGAVGAQKWDEISSAIIENMIHPPGKPGFSFDTFATAYGKLSENGKKMLFRSSHHMMHADAIEDIARISARIKSHNQYANPSGTGQSVMTGAGISGILLEPFTTVGVFLGANVLARVLAKPATARSMAAWSRAYSRAVTQNTPAARVGYENASRLFAASVGTELSRTDLVPTLTRHLQGAIPTRAEDE